jgi:type II secretory pathway pseudopilin PulG
MKNQHLSIRAFSLVELSIVIVILALIIGGIVAGRSLIRAAELRSVMTDANSYIAAINNFKQRYRYLPGDAPNAEGYWTAAATDNGNADGIVSGAERYLAWQHLNLSGLVEKAFTGAQGADGANDFVISNNVTAGNTPNSRIALTGFAFYYENVASSTTTYAADMGNMLTFGADVAGTNNGAPISAIFHPTDAYTIDTKMDDGMPGTGKWVANLTGGAVFGNAAACSTAVSGTDYVGTYRRTVEDIGCSFFISSGY